MSSDEDGPAVGLKHGGGRGRTGGFGYLYKQEFSQPFARALAMTIRSHKLPQNDVFSAAYTKMILEVLKTSFAEMARPVHEKLKKEGGKTMQWNSVSDMIRLFVFGVYNRDKIPLYILGAVQDIQDPKWRSFFLQRLVVKHNHRTVQRCIDTHRSPEATPPLMDLQGRNYEPGFPQQPRSCDFFDTIKVRNDDNVQEEEEEEEEDQDPAPAPVAAAPPAAAPRGAAQVVQEKITGNKREQRMSNLNKSNASAPAAPRQSLRRMRRRT